MDIWFLFQIAVNIVLVLGLVVVWAKLKRPPQDDPRLSRGLQLLQSKISVLEDLSDRTDKQVEQLTQLIEQKTRLLQSKIFDAEKQLQKVDQSMHRSLEVAEIFQDKIPHGEIIERQNTVKYVLAAQLAHKGMSIDEISEKVDLPREQIEFIAKVNKDELMFDEEQLPPWAKAQIEKVSGDEVDAAEFNAEFDEDIESIMVQETFAYQNSEDEIEEWDASQTVASNFELPQPELSTLKKLGEEFRQACVEFDEKQHRFDEEERRAQEAPLRVAQAAQKVGSKIGEAGSKITEAGGKISEKIGTRLGDRIGEKISAKLSGTMTEKIGKKIMSSSSDLLSEPAAAPMSSEPTKPAKFLPIMPESVAEAKAKTAEAKPQAKTKVHSPSRFEDSAKMRISEVPSSDIKKVLFPRIDLDDHLG